MLRLKCLNCGLTVPYQGSRGDLCPRCVVRENRVVELTTISDTPSTVARRSMGRLRIYTSVTGDRYTFSLSGELDMASAQVLDATLAEACSGGATEVVLDLGGVDFMDSEGLNAILRGKARCEEHSCRYSVTPAQRPVQRVFQATGVQREALAGGDEGDRGLLEVQPGKPPGDLGDVLPGSSELRGQGPE
jgi:anti-anti-sigma factor